MVAADKGQALIDALAEHIATRLDQVVTVLETAEERTVARLTEDSDAALDELEAFARQLLPSATGVVVGAGFAGTIRSSQGPLPTMVWWVCGADNSIIQRPHTANPNAEDFYDYTAQRWFARARAAGTKVVTGPFIDTWGSDDFTVTVSVPTDVGSGLDGVLAADLDIRGLVRDLSVAMADADLPIAVVNDSQRVVVSNIAALDTGLLLMPRHERARRDTPIVRSAPVPGYTWLVVQLELSAFGGTPSDR
jgi:hypothetical protein